MQITAKAKFIKTSSRKTRLVVDLVRGLKVDEALNQLKFSKKLSAKPVAKLINSAIANAEHNYKLDRNNLLIKEIKADVGPTIKRWRPRAHGRAAPIRKRMNHISVMLSEIKDSGKVKARSQKIEAPIKLGGSPKEEKKPKENKKEEQRGSKENQKEQAKEIIDPRGQGRGGHTKTEGKNTSSFASKIFRRKSG